MYDSITVRAGTRALAILREEGLKPERIRVLAGASGGPKWLVLAGLDRVLPELFTTRKNPLFLLGSSIGSWRMAALAQKEPLAAVEAFEDAYINQHYEDKPGIRDVTRESFRVMDAYLGPDAVRHIFAHPFMRTNILAVRSLHIGASDSTVAQAVHLGAAALANLASRRLLKYFFHRALFYDARDPSPFHGMDGFPLVRAALSPENFRKVLMASGSIPLVMEGMSGIPGTSGGVYRDGGIIDYHLDLPFNVKSDELVLYPHFYDHIVPGWFDKSLKRRNPVPAHMENVVLVSPSRDFIDALPMKKIPDRDDFKTFLGRDGERIIRWKEVAARSRRLGEEFMEAVQSRRIGEIAGPLKKR